MSLVNKLSEERRARLAAERLLELKQAELTAANRKLGRHALALTKQIGEKQAEVAHVRDENERVKSDLNIATEKAMIAERRLWHSIQVIEDGFAFFDADGKMMGANTAYINAFDGLEEVTPGVSYMRILQLLTDEGLVNTEGLQADEWRAKMLERWYSPNPEPVVIRWWSDQYIRLIDQRGADGDMVSLALDITSSVRYEKKLKKAREKAETASRAKSAFLANMSHEIRTPMNGVVGMAELLADTELTDEQQLYANTIRSSGEALLVIINDVLDYSKIEAEKLVLHPEPFDLERCIHEVATLLQPSARDKGLTLLVDYDVFMPTRFIGDPGRLRQVLTNLAGNALKFTKEGHVVVRVTGVAGDKNGPAQVHISVEDTGIGIPADKVDHVFGEFNQVDDARNREFEGTGLGLAISRRLVKMMGGSVWVDSTEGKGSVFGFRLPLPQDSEEVSNPPQVQPNLKTALVVSDQFVMCELLTKQLTQLGISVESCRSGAEAIEKVTGGQVTANLVLAEADLPDMQGPELVEALQRCGLGNSGFVILSDSPRTAQSMPGIELVDGILQRPYPRSELFARLAQLDPVGKRGESPALAVSGAEDGGPVDTPMPIVPEPPAETDEPPAAQSEDAPGSEAETVATPFMSRRAARKASPSETAEKPSREVETPKEPQNTDAAPTPLDPADETSPAQESSPNEAATQPAVELRRMRVLSAEDNKTNQLVFSKMVKTLDIDLRFANNGLEAVSAYEEFDPDLIFMDISMPGMDGKEATRQIRAREEGTGRHVPIMALTAHALDGDSEEILSAGLDRFMTKPLRKTAIHGCIAEHCPESARTPLPEESPLGRQPAA